MKNLSRHLQFEKLHNIRDLGGMRTSGGRTVVSGRLIRSGHLANLTDADSKQLEGIIDTVVDFRTDEERKENPDAEFLGVSYHILPPLDSLTPGVTREEKADRKVFETFLTKPEDAKRYMCETYRAFAEEPAAAQYRKFLDVLLEDHRKAVLWHCTAGKDRAGIASVIVEEILGIPREDIIADYLMTNEYLAADVKFLTAYVKKEAGTDSPLADEALKYMFGADEAFISEFYRRAEERSGDFGTFLRDVLKVTEEEILRMRELYLA